MDEIPIHFIHPSPGVGKTRFFLEMVRMGAKEKKAYIPENKHRQKKRAIVDYLLFIAVLFKSCTVYDSIHTKIRDYPTHSLI